MTITSHLLSLQDIEYKKFVRPIIPNISEENIIGIRVPTLRAFAKELCKSEDEKNAFLKSLPHKYFEENMLHALLITLEKDFERALSLLDAFLPFADCWALTDQKSPACFTKRKKELLPYIDKWISSKKTYTVRYAVHLLMQQFLDDDFDASYLEKVARIESGEYYVNMMRAWYFATALSKQYEATIPYLEKQRLDEWTHNKTIQKAIESRRITNGQKAYLRTLKNQKYMACADSETSSE